jgi:hypothetical protein
MALSYMRACTHTDLLSSLYFFLLLFEYTRTRIHTGFHREAVATLSFRDVHMQTGRRSNTDRNHTTAHKGPLTTFVEQKGGDRATDTHDERTEKKKKKKKEHGLQCNDNLKF